jgi:predicted nuclease of predicted toxin-antitoxin system
VTAFIVDAQLPPGLARMLAREFGLDALHVEDVGLRNAKDSVIAAELKARAAVIITKDHDFLTLAHSGRIPGVVLLTCGNVTNTRLREIVTRNIDRIMQLLATGENVIEVSS